jgi:apolipoprotein N-acyltransferase
MLKRLAPDWRTVLSAILIVIAFPPWNLYPLIWIAVIPWLAALRRAPSARAALLQGLWLSILMSFGGFYWVAHVLQQFGGLPGWLAFLGLLLFSLIGQPQFTLFAPFWRALREPGSVFQRLSSKPLGSLAVALLVALAYAGFDWLIPKLFVDTFGHSQYLATRLRQVADLGGATLLTFMVFLANESLYFLLTRLRARTEPSLWPVLRSAGLPVLASFALLAASWIYGHGRYKEVLELEAKAPRRLQAAVIQANIGDFEKVAAERGISGAAEKILETFFTMSDQALSHTPRPQVIIWPETSYPSTFRTPFTAEEMARDQRVENFARTRKVALLFGGYDRSNGKDFNAFFFLSPEAPGGVTGPGDLQVYRKNMLLLFGEYIPGAETFQWIKTAFPQVGNFGRGEGPSVLEIRTGEKDLAPVRSGPIICYEALFPNYVIAAARKGSQMILNITNDSWFGESGEPILHLSLTTFRSIETRLPQLRATNTGISSLILPNGEITQPTAIGSQEVLHVSVPIVEPMDTLMKRWGDWFGWFALLTGAWGLAGIYLARRRAA